MIILLLFVFAAFAFSLLSGGHLRYILDSGVRGFVFPVAAIIIQMGANLLCTEMLPREPWFAVGLSLSYLLSMIFVIVNCRFILFAVFGGLGTLANFAVIAANDFYMPIRFAVWEKNLYAEIPLNKAVAYTIETAETRLPFLGDIIYFPLRYFSGYASIGDFLLGIGLFFLIFAMTRPPKKNIAGKR